MRSALINLVCQAIGPIHHRQRTAGDIVTLWLFRALLLVLVGAVLCLVLTVVHFILKYW